MPNKKSKPDFRAWAKKFEQDHAELLQLEAIRKKEPKFSSKPGILSFPDLQKRVIKACYHAAHYEWQPPKWLQEAIGEKENEINKPLNAIKNLKAYINKHHAASKLIAHQWFNHAYDSNYRFFPVEDKKGWKWGLMSEKEEKLAVSIKSYPDQKSADRDANTAAYTLQKFKAKMPLEMLAHSLDELERACKQFKKDVKKKNWYMPDQYGPLWYPVKPKDEPKIIRRSHKYVAADGLIFELTLLFRCFVKRIPVKGQTKLPEGGKGPNVPRGKDYISQLLKATLNEDYTEDFIEKRLKNLTRAKVEYHFRNW